LVRLFSQQQQKKTTTTNSSCCPLADGGHSSMYNSSNTQEVSNTSMANRYKKNQRKISEGKNQELSSMLYCCRSSHGWFCFVFGHTLFVLVVVEYVSTQKKFGFGDF
jgi:hypothetical protein